MSIEASTSAAAASAPIPSSIPNSSAPAAPAPIAPVVAPAVVEPVAPAAGAPPAPDLSRGFASLAAEERRVRVAREETQAEAKKIATFTQQLAAARANPREAMKLFGFTDDQVLEALAGGAHAAPAVDDRVARLEQTLADRDRAAADAATRAQAAEQERQAEAVITGFRNDVNAQIKAAGDKYALIQLHGAESEVTAKIEKHLLEKGEFMPFETAADEIEAAYEAKARKALELPRLRSVPQSENPRSQSEQRTSSTNTLTNRGTTAPAANALPPLPLDPDARTTELLRRRGLAS